MKVRATQSTVVFVGDDSFTVEAGDAYDSRADVVKAHPWLFESDVEQATAAPGERRAR